MCYRRSFHLKGFDFLITVRTTHITTVTALETNLTGRPPNSTDLNATRARYFNMKIIGHV